MSLGSFQLNSLCTFYSYISSLVMHLSPEVRGIVSASFPVPDPLQLPLSHLLVL